jgi:Helix-turn-helix domain
MDPAEDVLGPLARTLGDLLAARRGLAGLTQAELARAVGYARTSIAGAETGARVPSEAFWSRCDGTLTAGGDLVRAYGRLAAARGARRSDAADRDQAERTARVTARLLAVQTAGAIGSTAEHVHTPARTDQQIPAKPSPSLSAPATPSPVPWNDEEHELGTVLDILARTWALRRGSNDPLVLDQVDLAISDFVERYEMQGPRPLVGQMVGLRVLIDDMLAGSPSNSGRHRLVSQGAQLSGILAYAATNLGRFTMARAYGLEAFAFASSASRGDLLAWIRGTQSFTEYYARRPRESLEFAQDGQRLARGGTESVRLAVNGEARAAALLGDDKAARAAIARAYAMSSKLGAPSGLTPCLSFDVYGEARTAANAATTLLHVGETPAVLEHTAEVIRIADASDSMWTQSLARLDWANALLADASPRPEEAAALGLHVATMPGVMLIESVRQRTADLVRDLSPWRSEALVGDFLDRAPQAIRSTASGRHHDGYNR